MQHVGEWLLSWQGFLWDLLSEVDTSDPLTLLTWIAPYVLPLVLGILARSPLVFIASAIAAEVTVIGLSREQPSSDGHQIAALLYVAGFCIMLAYALELLATRSKARRLARKYAALEQEFAAAQHDLDRERLWRRAGGDDRNQLDDDEIKLLVERVSRRSSASAGNGSMAGTGDFSPSSSPASVSTVGEAARTHSTS